MVKNKVVILLIFLCIINFSIIGCGNDGKNNNSTSAEGNTLTTKESSKEAKQLDVSILITKEEAEDAIGMPVEDAQISKQEAIGQHILYYNGKEFKPTAASFVQLSISRTQDMSHKQSAKTIFTGINNNLEDHQSIEGLGDEAFWGTGGLYVLKGEIFFSVAVGNTGKPENLEICKKLARIVLKRI